MELKDEIKAMISHYQDGIQMCQRILRKIGDEKEPTKEDRIREKLRITLLKKSAK